MATRTVLLVRHGAYSGESLTAIGRRQAKLTAARLSELNVTGIHSSTMTRAIETCETIAHRFPRLPTRRAHLLRECIPSVPHRFSKLARKLPRAAIMKNRNQADRAFRRFFRRARGEDCCDVIVCHGNLIRYLVSRVLGLGAHSWGSMGTHNCGISEIRITPRGETLLVSYNDVGHIPRRLRTP